MDTLEKLKQLKESKGTKTESSTRKEGNAMDNNGQPVIINTPPAPAPAPAPVAPAQPVIVNPPPSPNYQQGAGAANSIPWWGFMGGGYGGYGGGWGGGWGGRGYGGYGGGGWGHGAPYYVDQARREADSVRDTANQTATLKTSFTEQNLGKTITDGQLSSLLGQANITKEISEAALNSTLNQSNLANSISDSFARQTLQSCQQSADQRQQLADCCCDIQKSIADCCCETQKELLRSNFANQEGFARLDRSLCEQSSLTRQNDNDNTQKILNAISETTLTETRDKLAEAQRQAQEARLPAEILQTFRNCGCCPPPPNPCNGNGNGGGGVEINNDIFIGMNQMNRQIAELQGLMRAMQNGNGGPPGPPVTPTP